MKFKSKPIVIEAEQFTGDGQTKGVCTGSCPFDGQEIDSNGGGLPHLHTMREGQIVLLQKFDWVIPEKDGVHYYPCKPEIFAQRYEPA